MVNGYHLRNNPNRHYGWYWDFKPITPLEALFTELDRAMRAEESQEDMKFYLSYATVALTLLLSASCAPQKSDADLRNEAEQAASLKNVAANAPGDLVLKEIPAMPASTLVKAKEPTFRSRTFALPDGLWKLSFDTGEIKITTGKPKAYTLPMMWYPEEGGADGAFCSAYLDGTTTWIVLSGSSDFTNEVTRIRFVNGKMKSVIKHRVPGSQASLGNVVVLPADRIKTQEF